MLAAVRLGPQADRALRTVAVINFVLIAIVSLGVLAGRATITNVVLLVLLSMYLSGRFFRVTPRTVVLAAVAVVSVWYLSTSWISTLAEQRQLHRLEHGTIETHRPGDTARNAAASSAASASPARAASLPTTGRDEGVGLALVSIGYFASPIPTFHYYLQTPTLPGPFYGAYSFPLAARFVGTIDGTWTREQWYGLREEIYAPISSRGYFANVWSTWMRDLLVDFGYLGAGIFCALFGGMTARARNRPEATGALSSPLRPLGGDRGLRAWLWCIHKLLVRAVHCDAVHRRSRAHGLRPRQPERQSQPREPGWTQEAAIRRGGIQLTCQRGAKCPATSYAARARIRCC